MNSSHSLLLNLNLQKDGFLRPKNIESYYQQIGRGGRDGLEANCLMLFSYGDIQKIKYFMSNMNEQEAALAQVHLNSLVKYAETAECRRIPLLAYFNEVYEKDTCGMCDNCLHGEVPTIDLTQAAQKFLSCVKRTGERFGGAYVIDVLRGSKSQKVIEREHDQVSTYGIGKDQSKQEWFFLSTLLLSKELVTQNEFGSLSLTPAAWPVLKGEERFHGRFSQLQQNKIEQESQKRTKKVSINSDYNDEIYQALRATRRKLADKAGLPAYLIFSDKTLVELAAVVPQSQSELLAINGIGEVKLKRYGKDFLEVLQEFS